MKNRTLSIKIGALLALVFCQILEGCFGPSGIRTMIHEDPRNRVYLEWVESETFRASHPHDFSPTLIRQILSGVMVQYPPGIIKGLLREKSESLPVFSDEDLQFLIPHVVSALSQVTPEEHVVLQRTYASPSRNTKTVGTIYVKDELLYLTITELGHRHKGPAFIFYGGNREIPDETGLRDIHISFSPKSAWRQDIKKIGSTISHSLGKTLVIEYRKFFPNNSNY